MSLDPVKVSDAQTWLLKARNDIRAAEALLRAEPSLADEISFHCQQSVEKSLKGFLFWNNTPFARTHDLNVIGQLCTAIDPSLTSLVRQAAPLTQFAVDYRYPGQIIHPSLTEIEEAVALANDIWNEIIKRLPSEAHPS